MCVFSSSVEVKIHILGYYHSVLKQFDFLAAFQAKLKLNAIVEVKIFDCITETMQVHLPRLTQ